MTTRAPERPRRARLATVALLLPAVLAGCASAGGAGAAAPSAGGSSPAAALSPSATAAPTAVPFPSAQPAETGAPAGTDRADDRHAVTPTVTYADAGAAGTYEVSGLVPDVVEDGGSCVVELTQGDVTVRREQAATADATSTTCGSIVVPAADLRPGSWSVVLRYASPWSAGSSAAVDLEVR